MLIMDELTNEANQSGDVFRFEELTGEDTTFSLYPTDETSQGRGFLADQLFFKYKQKA